LFFRIYRGFRGTEGARFTHGFYEDCKRDGEFSLPFFHFDFILAML